MVSFEKRRDAVSSGLRIISVCIVESKGPAELEMLPVMNREFASGEVVLVMTDKSIAECRPIASQLLITHGDISNQLVLPWEKVNRYWMPSDLLGVTGLN